MKLMRSLVKAQVFVHGTRNGLRHIPICNEIKLEILPYSQYRLDAILMEGGADPWRLTCVYGEAQVAEMFKTWDMLKYIKSTVDLPLMCIGDFNEVLRQHEHVGAADRSMAQIAGFHDAVDVCELADLGFEGNSWTFEKQVVGGQFCRVRLDRALATASWRGRFPIANVRHPTASTSDHCPILLRWKETTREHRRTEDKIIRYELMWESHENFKPSLEEVWRCNTPGINPTWQCYTHFNTIQN
jgi:hypothetical protein